MQKILLRKNQKSMDVKSISLNRLLDIILSEITIFFENLEVSKRLCSLV